MRIARRFQACSQWIGGAAALMLAASAAVAGELKIADANEKGDGTLGAAAAQALAHGPLPFSAAERAVKARANRSTGKGQAGDRAALGVEPRIHFPVVLLSEDGKRDETVTPPDTAGAIGTKRFIQLVNHKAAIYDRDDLTHIIGEGSLNDLAGLDSSVESFSPQVMWDAQTKRFYYVMDSVFSASDNRLSFGFSKTPAPGNLTTDWCHYTLKRGSRFPDYPRLGDSQYFVLVGTNGYSDADTFAGADLTALTKPRKGTDCPDPKKLKERTKNNLTDSDGNPVFTPVPAQQIDNSETGYVAARTGDLTTASDRLWFFNVRRDPDTHLPIFGSARAVEVDSYAVPPDAGQPTLTQKLDTLDARLTQAVQAIDPRGGTFSFWTQHTIANGPVSAVRWYEIDPVPAVPDVLRRAVIRDSSSFLFNAAISPDRVRDGSTLAFGDSFVIEYNASSITSKLSPRIVAASSVRGSASPCIFVRGSSLSFAGVHFVLAEQWVIILHRSGLFADCRQICCDSVATDRTKEGWEDGLWLGTDARRRFAHTSFNRSFTTG
jgi:hypothetical protein